MMTIHKITAGDGYTYLTRHIAGGDVDRQRGQDATDYYTAEGNPPGQWTGQGVGGLGITAGARVDEAQMRALFGFGWHPDAEKMIAEYQAAHITAGMTAQQLEAVAGQARKHAALGRQFPVYEALDPYEDRVSRRLSVIADDMGRPATEPEVKKVRREESGRQRSAVAGYDVVFAPVKSAALLWALDERDQVRASVRAAHEDAKASALKMLEQHAAYTRTGKGGIAQIETKGLVAVAFDHYDSRCGDPNLHTHVVIANKIQGTDGKWRSLDATVLYQMTVAASEHYNSTFETALTARLGVNFAARPGSIAGKEPVREIEGIPAAWIGLFSKRRNQMEARYDELLRDFRRDHGRDPDAKAAHQLARQATLDTRDGKKPPRSLEAMRADWREQIAHAHGSDSQNLLNRIITEPNSWPAVAELSEAQIGELATTVIGRVAASRSTWTRWNVHAETQRALREWTTTAGPFASVAVQEAAAEAVTSRAISPAHSILIDAPAMVAEPQALRRADGESVFARHSAARYTSEQILQAEQRLVDAATTPALSGLSAVTVAQSLAAFEQREGRTLDAGQRHLVTAFATADTRIAAGIGAAGTGKTTAMKAFRHVTETHGRRLIPLATSAASAAVLGDDIGTQAENLHKFLWEHQHGKEAHALTHGGALSAARVWFAVNPGDVIVVDEAGMAGTLLLDQLAVIAARRQASIKLLGDWRQLGAVESGGALRLIASEAGAVELTSLHRFTNPAEGTATLGLRTGDTTALDFYQAHGRITGGSRQAMSDAVYDAWKTDMLEGRITLMIAATNRDITALSARARTERITAGQVEAVGVPLADHNVAGVGDWIVTRNNNRRITTCRGKDFVKNGDAWTVVKRLRDGSLKVRHQEHRGTATLPASYVAAHVQLHYATTTHRAQGSTVDTAHLLVDDQLTRENLYVAMTRARIANYAYVTTHELLPLDEDERLDRPRYDPDARAAREVLDTILNREGAMLSATETIRRTQQQAESLSTLIPRHQHAAEQATTAGYQQLVHTLFDPDIAEVLTDDAAFSAVVRALHRGETQGWQPEQLLATAMRRGPLTRADSPAELLAWRCAKTLDEHQPPAPLAQPTIQDATRYAQLAASLTGLTGAQLNPGRATLRPTALTVDSRLASAREADHYQSIIIGVLGSHDTIRAVNDSAWPALTAAVRRAEHAGHHPADVLHQAYASRELDTADSISEVLAWRIGRYLDRQPAPSSSDPAGAFQRLAWTLKAAEQRGIDLTAATGDIRGQLTIDELQRHLEAVTRRHRAPEDPGSTLPAWVAANRPGAPGLDRYLAENTAQISARISELATEAAHARPAWATVFGMPPGNEQSKEQWLGLLGIAAAYRDQYQITDDTSVQPLGAYVEAGRAGHHAYWKAAEAVIAAARLTEGADQQPAVDRLAHRIAADIFTALPADERAGIGNAMASRLGPLWLGDPADTDAAAMQTSYARELISELRERGHLRPEATPITGESTIDMQQAHHALVAKEAERLAHLAHEILSRHQVPVPEPEIGTRLLPAKPEPSQGPQPRW